MKAKTYAYKMNNPALQALVDIIVANGAGKVELADASPTYADFAILAGECSTAANAAQMAYDAWQTKRTLSENKYTTMREQVNLFAQSVDAIYDGDVAQIQALGLGIRNPALPIGPLLAPENLRVAALAMPKIVSIRWKRVRGRLVYEAEWAAAASGPWTQFYAAGDNAALCVDLTSGAEVWFRVRARGPLGPSPWSQSACCRPN